jgi:hypothetical protein
VGHTLTDYIVTPQTSQRVLLADGSDFVVLPVSISVGEAE